MIEVKRPPNLANVYFKEIAGFSFFTLIPPDCIEQLPASQNRARVFGQCKQDDDYDEY